MEIEQKEKLLLLEAEQEEKRPEMEQKEKRLHLEAKREEK